MVYLKNEKGGVMYKLKTNRAVSLGVLCLLLLMAIGLTFAADLEDVGGKVLSSDVKPYGYSLDDIARAMALFSSSSNVQHYPTTPFQLLFTDPNTAPTTSTVTCPDGGQGTFLVAANTFPVTAGVAFFVPLFFVDDTPPVLGVFPTQKSQAADYFFGATQYGGRDMEIIVDGRSTAVGADFLGGPVETPPLLDALSASFCQQNSIPGCGKAGTHFMQLGAFIAPMSVGVHTAEIKGQLGNSTLFSNTFAPFYGSCLQEDITYKVKVFPRLETE
jgi:hypothetical protein